LLDDAHGLQLHMSADKSASAVVLPINTKNLANSFNFFFKNGELSPKKCNKSQNIPNMKTKLFSYPSIVFWLHMENQTQKSGYFHTSGN
jgi:hypothetical protein